MSQVSDTNIFMHSKAHSYEDLDEESLIKIFPRIYLTSENIEDFVFTRFRQSHFIAQAVELLNLADDLALVDFSRVWNEAVMSQSKK